MIDFGVIDKIIAIIFSLGILLNGYVVGKIVKTFLFPASLFCFFWFAYTFFPLVFLFNVPINPISIIFIFFCTLLFCLASLFFDWKKAFNRNKLKLQLPANYFCNKHIIRVFNLLFIVTLLFLLIDIRIQGFEIVSFLFNFYESSNSFIAKRYSHEIVSNVYAQMANVFNYVLVMLGSVIVGSAIFSNARKYKLALMTLIPSIIITLTQGAKGTILLSVVLFYGGILIIRIFRNKLELTNKKTNRVFVIIFVSLFGVLLLSFMSRGIYEESNSDAIDKLLFYFNSYSFGHIYAFSDWFDFQLFNTKSVITYANSPGLNYGFYTFMYFFRLLGDTTIVPDGIFDDYFYYKGVFVTNIFTVFRGTILDFGVLGSCLFWFVSGFFSSVIYYVLLSLKRPIITIPLFIMMIGYFYTTFIISLFIWRSIFAAILVFALILFYNKLKIKN